MYLSKQHWILVGFLQSCKNGPRMQCCRRSSITLYQASVEVDEVHRLLKKDTIIPIFKEFDKGNIKNIDRWCYRLMFSRSLSEESQNSLCLIWTRVVYLVEMNMDLRTAYRVPYNWCNTNIDIAITGVMERSWCDVPRF